MAEALPAQVDRRCLAGVLIAACTIPACAPEKDNNGSAAANASTGRTAAPTANRDEKPEPRTPEEVVERLLETCHGTLKSAEGMSNSSIKLRRAADDTVPEQVKLGAGDCIEITLRDRTRKIQIANGRAWHVFPHETPVKNEPIEGEARKKFERFQRLLRAALLEPLYRFERVTRQGPNVYALILPFGETWRLELREVDPPEEAPVLLPYELSGPPGTIRFEEHLHTGVTHLPGKVALGEFGVRWFALELSGLTFDEDVFADPTTKPRQTTVLVHPTAIGNDPAVGEVGLKRVAAKTALVLPDPGDWKSRFELLLKSGEELGSQGQQAADLDFLFDEGGKRYLAMPFEAADKERGGRAFVAKKHQRILKLPAEEVAIVYPKNGDLESNEKIAKKLLDAFVAEHELRATGPMRIIPWIEVDKPLPSERELNHLRIGFELPVMKR